MSDTATHFSDMAGTEQGAKGVKTGFNEKEALVFIEECGSAWKESTYLNVQLLRALCRLSIDNPEKAKVGFTSQELVGAISIIRSRPWSNSSDKEQMSDDIRQQWNRLQKTWETKREGITQQFSDANIPYLPKPSKTEGGGSGNLTLHRLEWMPLKATPFQPDSSTTVNSDGLRTNTVRYVCEDIQEPNPLAKIFAKGFRRKDGGGSSISSFLRRLSSYSGCSSSNWSSGSLWNTPLGTETFSRPYYRSV